MHLNCPYELSFDVSSGYVIPQIEVHQGMSKCSTCGRRKGKRRCPALLNYICPLCCGESRLKRIQCPSNCAYLQQARSIEVEKRERELQKRSATASTIELEVASYPIREAIVTYTSMRPEFSDEDVLTVLSALEDAVHREMAQGTKVTPKLPERFSELTKAITDNVSVMRSEVGFPHNAALLRAIRALRQEAETVSRHTGEPRSFIKTLRASVKPHSLHDFISQLKSREGEGAQQRIILPR